jgi:hypothetical protein
MTTDGAGTKGSTRWDDTVGTFARIVGMTVADLTPVLARLVGAPDDEGVSILLDPACASDEMFVQALPEVPRARLMKAIREMRASAAPVPAAPGAAAAASLLPTPPDDESFLEALKVGGQVLVEATDINAALRAFLAHKLGLLDTPERLMATMEKFALSIDRPVEESFYEVQKLVTERRYGDVLAAFGLSGRWVSAERKKQLFSRMAGLWQILRSFQERLRAWNQACIDRMSSPGAMMNLVALVTKGTPVTSMPGLTDYPEVGPLRDAAEGIIDSFNRMFAGTGVPVARALAYDALRIKSLLDDPRLPAAIGQTTKELALKTLGIAVTAEYVRLERDLSTFVLSILEVPRVSKEKEAFFMIALENLGETIPWSTLLALDEKAPEAAGGKHQRF